MDLPALLPLSEALAVLSAQSGQTWTRSIFFGLVVDHGLPLRGTAPETARPVIASGEVYVCANLPYRGRRLAVLSTPQAKDLWLHGEAKTRSVALERGEPGYLDWDQVKARRAVLNRSAHVPGTWEAGSPNSDWHDGEYMGECDVSLFSEVVRVTDDNCFVPRETIEELLAAVAKQNDARAVRPEGKANELAQVGDFDQEAGPHIARSAQKASPVVNNVRAVSDAVTAQDTSAVDMSGATDALARLFDPVTSAALEKMFPAAGKWTKWVERAARNGLKDSREGRGAFNPYLAALWFLGQGESGWDLARCHRVLASNLPARSRRDEYKLTGLLD